MLHNKIIFLRGLDIWMIDPDTRREQMILKNPFPKSDWAPTAQAVTFSPDCKHVLITSGEMFIIHPGLSGKERVTYTHLTSMVNPQWSPDGRQIAYTQGIPYHMGGPTSSAEDIHLVDADGTNDRPLLTDLAADVHHSDFSVFWKRDGKRLLFTRYLGDIEYFDEGTTKPELKTCDLNGNDVQPFDGNRGDFLLPSVSPDGKFRLGGESTIRAAPLDDTPYNTTLFLFTSRGQPMRSLTGYSGDLKVEKWRWSKDSNRVAFGATQKYILVGKEGYTRPIQETGIWLIGRDGKKLRRLTTNASLITWLH